MACPCDCLCTVSTRDVDGNVLEFFLLLLQPGSMVVVAGGGGTGVAKQSGGWRSCLLDTSVTVTGRGRNTNKQSPSHDVRYAPVVRGVGNLMCVVRTTVLLLLPLLLRVCLRWREKCLRWFLLCIGIALAVAPQYPLNETQQWQAQGRHRGD